MNPIDWNSIPWERIAGLYDSWEEIDPANGRNRLNEMTHLIDVYKILYASKGYVTAQILADAGEFMFFLTFPGRDSDYWVCPAKAIPRDLGEFLRDYPEEGSGHDFPRAIDNFLKQFWEEFWHPLTVVEHHELHGDVSADESIMRRLKAP